MSGSDDTSDFISQSPFSHSSPYSSPSQQVPQLTDYMTDLTCADGLRRDGPYLHIVDEPMNHFRFRYKSEMIGTHGCLLGASHPNSKSKTHPTVELRNYSGSAIIHCTLVRHNNNKEHPHKLQDDHDRDVSSIVPDQGSYKVAFSGMGIIHTAKKDVPATLFKKYSQEMGTRVVNEERLRVMCENEAREINLNIVRLKFTAHDLATNMEICKPVFSKPIHNLKSAATNDLKICRMSRIEGRACGGDDVFLFVEKVKKTNIKVRFFELNEMGERVWSNVGDFRQADVHHQYGIVFQTPPYENKEIKTDVNVFIELVRPSDGRTSEPKPFTYKAHPLHKQNKKRKANSYSSMDSSGSLSSDLPVTVSRVNQNYNRNQPDVEAMEDIPSFTIKIPEPCESTSNPVDNLIGDAMLHDLGAEPLAYAPQFSSALQQPSMADPPVLHFNSSEIARLLEFNENMTADEKKLITQLDLNDYFSFPSNPGSMNYIKCSLVADSGRANPNLKTPKKAEPTQKFIKDKTHYSACYSSEDGAEVKKLVKEICEIIRNKTGYKKQIVRTKLERLFEMRLSNGDAFLHMTLCSNQPSLEYIVKLIHNMKMTRLLNIKNYQMQTILHLAIINDCPKVVSFLISMGCDPMIEDNEGNNAVHYAVICRTCLEPLLESVKKFEVACDLNAFNYDKQSALHLAALYDSAKSAALLVRAGASPGVRDRAARTPLHLAVHDRCLPVVQALLDAPQPGDIDAVDDIGYTALQMVCDADVLDDSLEIVTLLLEKKADPMKCTGETKPAWKLARNKPAIMNVLKKYVILPDMSEDDIKSEPEDEYESADEGEMEDCGGLPELSLYVDEVADILDQSGVWRDLAKRLSRDSLISWYTCGISPTKTLLNHIKTYDDSYTSRSLARLLEDMGQVEAATIIRRYISK